MARRTTNDGRRTTDDGRRTTSFDYWSLAVCRWSVVAALALLLSGCLLMSGEQASADAQPTGGNFNTTFVSAEGGQERTIATNAGPTTMNVITTVRVQQGELRVEMLSPTGAVALSIQGRPDEPVTKLGKVPTDNQGNLHYRIVARGARNGSIEVLYQPTEP
jgi:hypothetical protein